MHPPALVLPASVSIMVQSLSDIILSRISAAFAVSRDVKDISLIELIMGVESKDAMSICFIRSFKRSDFFISLKFYGSPKLLIYFTVSNEK